MKKIIAIILGLFLTIGFVGCNSDGSDINIDMDEFIDNPTNLTITGDTLSWDAVADAEGYIVYANDEEVEKVKTNSFDFGSLSGDVLIFQVRTRAPRGMQDSALSAKLAYVANKAQEVTNVTELLAESNMPFGSAFAEELVNKGMVSADVQSMVDEMDDFTAAMDSVETFEDFIDAMRGLIVEADNIEAVVSALVKSQLVDYLEMLISDLEYEIQYYEDEMDNPYTWYSYDYLQSQIDSYQMQIDAYEDLIDQIDSNPDMIVLAITSTIEYFISIEEMISDDLVSLVDGLADVQEPTDLNVNELVDIKEEIVSILRETMPTEEEMVLVLEVMDLISSLSGTTVNYDSVVENYKGKMAAQSLYSLEAFINFLDTFDKAFFEAFKALSINEDLTEPMYGAEVGILVVKYFNTFYDDNENLLDTINEVFTEEEQLALFDEYKDIMSLMDGTDYESVAGILDAMNFQQLLDLQVIFEDSFGALLDAFVDSDGEIVRQMVISQSFSWRDYSNFATGIEYSTDTAFEEARQFANLDLMSEVFVMLNAFVQSMDPDELNEVTSFMLDSIFVGILPQFFGTDSYYEFPFTESDITDAKDVIQDGLDLASEDLLTFLQAALEYVVDEDVWQDYKVVLQDGFDYFASEYGTDYRGEYNPEFWDDEYDMNASLIFAAGIYDDFMTSRNRGTLDDILEVVFDTMSDSALTSLTGMTAAQITDMETQLGDILDYLSDQFNDIAKLDYDNLSAGDLADIEAFQEGIAELMMALAGGLGQLID